MDVIYYPCWDLSLTMLVKGATDIHTGDLSSNDRLDERLWDFLTDAY